MYNYTMTITVPKTGGSIRCCCSASSKKILIQCSCTLVRYAFSTAFADCLQEDEYEPAMIFRGVCKKY